MKRAIFPGTFDPFTIGHHSIVKRALTFMDEIVIGIGINEGKKNCISTEKRLEMIRKLYADEPRVKVEAYSDLTIDFAKYNKHFATSKALYSCFILPLSLFLSLYLFIWIIFNIS